MPSYDSILFDFDGVLADSEPLHYRCWKHILSPYGINLEWDEYASQFIGISDRVMLARFCEAAVPPVDTKGETRRVALDEEDENAKTKMVDPMPPSGQNDPPAPKK